MVTSTTAEADVIDFESGFVDRQQLTAPIVTATNALEIKVDDGTTVIDAYIARVGSPQTAFYDNDLPIPAGGAGSFFLTDEDASGVVPTVQGKYYFAFNEPVLDLSLELYDLELDGNTVTLTAYADPGRTVVVGVDSETITGTAPEGLVTPLSIPSPSAPILAFTVETTDPVDTGNGIDNIAFTTVPGVPFSGAPMKGLLCVLLFGLGIVRARGQNASRARR